MMFRLEAHAQEWIDRSVIVSFHFEGRSLRGYSGDTISTALLAAGEHFLGRSFKYHRRRSVLSFANHDSNTLFQVDGVPNVRGDVTLLRDGMRVAAVNTFGGLAHDKARVLDRFSRWLPVGFYYKAFHSKRWFPRWERMFRALTGLGAVSLDASHRASAKRYAFCDVLVLGGGISGLSAALEAAAGGARVAIVDEATQLGGEDSSLLPDERSTRRTLIEAVRGNAAISVFCSTVAAGYYADHWVSLFESGRLTKMRARSVVFATGVIAQPAVFRNNDLPGVMLASGAARLVSRYRVSPGRRVVMIAGNLEAYRISLALRAEGVTIVAIVDLRAPAESAEDAAACSAAGIAIHAAHAPFQAIAGEYGAVAALEFGPLDAAGKIDTWQCRRIECDAVLMSVGWAAASQLLLQAGGTTEFSGVLQQYVPRQLPPGVFACGRLNGVHEFESRLADGRRAGALAAAQGHAEKAPVAVKDADAVAAAASLRGSRRPTHAFPIFDHPAGKNFVDFDEDLQVKDLENAAQEGFDSSELLKRYSTVGMGPSQGKHSNMNALRILARIRGLGVESLGMTTARPMYHPVPLKSLAGRGFAAERRTPLDALHRELRAVWMPAGNWRRPEYYARAGESRASCIEAEVRSVRQRAGMIDVGTLGKIEIYGPQAGEFLDRVYTGRFSDLPVGKTRYGLMLDESGVVVDDGVAARLAPEMFYFSTTTGNSATVFRELLRLNALWGLNCALVNVTGHRAAINLAGPSSRAVLQPLTDVDLGDAAFPFLGARTGHVAGIAARLLRVGFVGEVGYEIHVAASSAAQLWSALAAAGSAQGLRAFGVEAQRVLRLEKGHFIVGQDTDGLTDPFEANAAWAVNMLKPFFVGQRSLKILQKRGPRQKLMGIEFADAQRLPKECHLVIENGAIAGRVTSVVHSQTLNKGIGLAMLTPHFTPGSVLQIRGDDGHMLQARVAKLPFYDPENLRQRQSVAA